MTFNQTPADFSGHWLMSWGIIQLTQNGNEAGGRYSADDYGKMEGKIVGPRMNFQWRTQLRGLSLPPSKTLYVGYHGTFTLPVERLRELLPNVEVKSPREGPAP